MSTKLKKFISILLVVLICFSTSSVAFAADNPSGKISVDLSSDKKEYINGESISIDTVVSNTFDSKQEVELTYKATPYVKLGVTSEKISLSENESKELNQTATARRIIMSRYKLQQMADGFMSHLCSTVYVLVSLCSNSYERLWVTVDGKPAVVLAKVSVNNDSSEVPNDDKSNVSIDKNLFTYNEESNIYSISDVIEEITGTLKNVEKVTALEFSVYDINNNELDSGKIDIASEWSTEEIDLMLGENILTVSAIYDNGKVSKDSITVRCLTDAYMDNIEIDTNTDTDGDKIVDYLELNYTGTDITKKDTDSDGLTDCEDVYLFGYDPLKKDSDDDGIFDSDEDFDGDGITNIKEIQMGLDPTFDDSDLDGLVDSKEIDTYKTDPMNKDTDGDGVSDGDEIRVGSDPLKKEIKFVESKKSGEICENSPVSAEVKVDVTDEQVGTLVINPVTYSDNAMISPTVPGYLGVAYDFTINGEISNAELVFNYDTSLGELGENFQPRIYYCNEKTKMFEELPNQKVENGKVTATTTHFSTYILLNKVEFDKVWETEIKTPATDPNQQFTGLDIVFVIDSSGSMSSNDNNGLRKTAAKNFVNKLTENDRAAVVDFDGSSRIYQNFTKDKAALTNAIDRVDSSGGTSLSAGISTAINLFTNSSYDRTDAFKYIIFLTDGDGSYSTSYTATAANNNIVIYTIGLGSGVRESTLKNIASGTGGKYYFASEADALEPIYDEISFETIDYSSDKNKDGIPDYYNDLLYHGELVLSNGSNEFMGINFNYDESQKSRALCADMDGDGLLNGEELVIRTSGDKVYVDRISDPCMTDTDGDGFDDYKENKLGSDATSSSYSTESINFILNDENYTYCEVFKEEDKWFDSIARNIWSTITLNLSHKDEAQGLVTKFLTEQAELENIQNLANVVEKEMAENLAAQVINEATLNIVDLVDKATDGTNIAWDTIDGIDQFAHLKINMKKWVNAGNSAKNLSSSHWTQFKAQIGLFNKWSKSFKWVSKVGKVMQWLPVINLAVDESIDFANTAKTYSALAASSENFIVFEDILSNIVNNDDMDEKYVAKGVRPILNSMQDSEYSFVNDFCRDISVATTENLASIAITLLSAHNPVLIAINVLVSLIDGFWLGDITEGAYALYVVNELVNSPKSLFVCDSGSTLCSFDESQKINLRFICSARSVGGQYAKQIVNKQTFWGEKDSVVRERVGEAIDDENEIMYQHYDKLEL